MKVNLRKSFQISFYLVGNRNLMQRHLGSIWMSIDDGDLRFQLISIFLILFFLSTFGLLAISETQSFKNIQQS